MEIDRWLDERLQVVEADGVRRSISRLQDIAELMIRNDGVLQPRVWAVAREELALGSGLSSEQMSRLFYYTAFIEGYLYGVSVDDKDDIAISELHDRIGRKVREILNEILDGPVLGPETGLGEPGSPAP